MTAVTGSLRRPAAVAAAIWVVHWGVLRLTGQAYGIRVLYAGWQYLPADAVAAAPLRSVWSLHTQPPGWNLLVAAVHAWSPLSVSASHQLVTVVLGAALAAAVADTLGALGLGGRWATAIAVVATANSQVMSNAFEPRYDLAVTTALAVLVWAAVTRRTIVPAIAVATLLVMTRSLFHPVWLAVTIAAVALLAATRPTRRQLALAIAVPALVVGGWVVKNATQFGTVGLSSFTGMNLLRSVEPAVDDATMQRLVADGSVSGVAAAGTFRFYADYAASVPACSPEPGDPAALASPTKPIPEDLRVGLDPADTANFNYRCYLDVYAQAGDDALAIARARPGDWARARLWAVNNWFQVPAAAGPEESPLWDVEVAVSRLVLLGVPHPGLPDRWDDLWAHRNPISLTLVAATAVVVAAAAGRRRALRTPAGGALALVVWIVAWNSLAGIVFELGEQERFRSTTDPLVLALGGWWVLTRLDRGRSRSEPGPAHEPDG